MNKPYSALAHLGCAGLGILAAMSCQLALAAGDFHEWLLIHPFTMPLLCLAALTAAYLLEHALSTTAMLALLLLSAICAGLAVSGGIVCDHMVLHPMRGTLISSNAGAAIVWQLLSGPIGYFATAALVLHCWSSRLYHWQLCCIFTAGALLLPFLVCPLSGASPITTLCALGLGLITATMELCVLFSRDYFEITSESRTRSTVIGMVQLITLPLYRGLMHVLTGCYYGGSLLLRFLRWW